jgi:hypothetical protein
VPVSCPTPVGKATPESVWKAALSALRAADTSTYRVQSETALPEGRLTLSRSTKVDATRRLGEFSGSVAIQGGTSPTKDSVTVVVDGDEAYLQAASWTGDRKGKWMRLPEASSEDAEVPFEVTLDTLPAELVDFVPHGVKEEYGSTLVFGRIPAPAALSALGLGHLLLKDRALADSLSGTLGATARLGNNGCLESVTLSGQNSRVKGSSTKVPAGILEALVRSSYARIFISSVGVPQTVVVPPADSLIDPGPRA